MDIFSHSVLLIVYAKITPIALWLSVFLLFKIN